MTIAVTAVSGQLGSAIASALVAKKTGQPIVGLARDPGKVRVPGIEVRQGDYAEPETLESSLSGVKTLLLVSLNNAPEARIALHRNAILAARRGGVRRLVYTSVQGAESGTAFSPVVQSNRQTEADVQDSGMDWVIGRNGIYIEPDVQYIDSYRKAGEIANCAGDGLCGYTTRAELAAAYASMLCDDRHIGQTYHLNGELMSQADLAAHLNGAFGTTLTYRPMSADAYRADRVAELGEMMGTIIAGIYEGIRMGVFDKAGDFEAAAGRPHQSWEAYFASLQTTCQQEDRKEDR